MKSTPFHLPCWRSYMHVLLIIGMLCAVDVSPCCMFLTIAVWVTKSVDVRCTFVILWVRLSKFPCHQRTMWPEIPSHRPKNHAIQSNELDNKYCVAWIAIIIGPKPCTLSCPSWLMGKSCCSICKMLLVGLYQILWFASLSCIKILVLHLVPACLRYSKYMLRGSSINKAWRFMILHNPPLTNSRYVPEYPITCRKWHLVPRKFTLVQTIISGVWESDGFVDVAHCWWHCWFCTHCSHQLLYKRGHLSRNPAAISWVISFLYVVLKFWFWIQVGYLVQ